jgi:hypothetical protein
VPEPVTTREVDPDELARALANARVSVAWVVDGNVVLSRASLSREGGTLTVRVLDAPAPAPGTEVVVLSDDGSFYFDLRALVERGAASVSDERTISLTPTVRTAWDYGQLRRR